MGNPTSIDGDEVRRIAVLASLELEPEAIEELRRELQSILDYVKLLDELDVSSVSPAEDPAEKEARLRDDVPRESLSQEEALRNAPDSDEGHFRVPRVIDG